MTQEELINLARQANGEETWPGGVDWTWEELHTFAKLVEENVAPQRCHNCASLEAQNTELDAKLADYEKVETNK